MNETEFYERLDLKKEMMPALIYFAAYMTYLFFSLENEFWHWVTLVIIPFLLLYSFHKLVRPSASLRWTLASIGLKKENLTAGLGWAILLGLLLSAAQLFLSRSSEAIWQIIRSGKVAYLFPLTFLMMLGLAGFTEEFFFRGILQTRLSQSLRSNLWGVVATAVLFGFYHLPYAYLNPHWPSHGDWNAAISAAFSQGGLGGLILGTVYVKSKNNLLACIIVHSLINAFPAMTMIKFSR